MIYIKNNTEIQTIFIPRSELQKEAYIASTKTYEDGYNDGFGKGKQYQKDQMLNLYVTENGEYEREDGWGIVTVDIPTTDCPDCPEGGTCNLGEGEIYLTANDAGFYELYAADDGYDGWSKFYVTLENGGAIKIHKASDLLDFFNNGGQIDFGAYCYVGGKITDIQEISMEWGNATYTLDNGFKIYRGKWIDDNPFSEDQIKVGAYIVVYGIIQDYKGELQLKAHSQVIAYQECEGGDLNIDAVSTSLGAGNWNKWTRNAADYGLDAISEITIDGSQYQEWTKAHTLLQAYQNTEEAYITENGEYRPNIGYDGFALKGYNVGWVIDVIPTLDTDVEIWVKPYDNAPNYWQGFIGSQVSDDDNTTFQIRKTDGANVFSFRFGEQIFEYGFEYERWYRLRMNRNGVWVNGEQVCGWDVQAFEENPNPLMINGIYNLGFENENYRMNNASYGYVYFHNTDSLLVPFNNGLFIGNKNKTIGRPAADGATLRLERNWYPKGYTKVTVDVQNGGCNLEDKWVTPSMSERDDNGLIVVDQSEGYDGLDRVVIDPTTIYNEGVAAGGSCNLINPIIFSETEGNTINAESVVIPIFAYEGNQHYNVWALNMAEYEDFKIQLRFQANNGGNEEPVNIFGCEDTDWDDTTFGARIYEGQIYFKMSGNEVSYTYSDYVWYDVEMGYNSSKRWVIVNGETLFENDHSSFNKPNQPLMMGAINSGGNAFRPFYGKIAATYIEANGNQVWLLPKEEGHMDVYWNDRSSPWIAISGENNARFETDWLNGDGMKSITWLSKRASCPPAQEQITDYIYNQVTLYSYRNIGFDSLEECFYDSNNEPITDVLIVVEKVDFEYAFKFFTKVPIKTCSKIPYPNNPLYGLTRLYFISIPSVNLNYKDNDVLYLYIEDVDYLNMNGATLNGLLRIWLKGSATFSQGLEIGTAQIKDSGTVYSDGTNTDKLSSSFSTWTIINDHKLP